ncbi:hypothetical protein JOC37_002159 [Desulfohalotomaculum tongense]|uniref:FhaA domain-containing protein n=1 Tax=Desulforadius tongensis TaxID=1216062 RepID=UPI00195D35F5|nr:DUF3662 and FHA domain-containing protein [Desulforadius tongensis]MBM7855744.1 hypothetical protein [Desulforadius tongensis]
MGLFSDWESNLEKYIEKFFRGKLKSHVQPVDIAKKLYREMISYRRVSVNKIYVPNEYKVLLHPGDWESIGAFHKSLVLELQDYLVQKAREKELTPVAPPVVILKKSDDIEPGEMEVQASFSEAVPVNRELIRRKQKEKEPPDTNQDTMLYKPVKDSAMPKPEKTYRLVVEEGQDKGKEFPLGNYRMVIGRRDTCDIVLADPSVSRRHAQLDNQDSRYVLTDLNSTNGTFVNGEKITKKLLEPEDVITIGTTVCIFKVD